MEVTLLERVLSILIPVLIASAGTIPALLAHFRKPRKAEIKKEEAAAQKEAAEAETIQINSMQAVLEATNKLLIDPLKARITELESENRSLRACVDKLEEENTTQKQEIKKLRADMLDALLALDNCRKDLQIRLKALEKKGT